MRCAWSARYRRRCNESYRLGEVLRRVLGNHGYGVCRGEVPVKPPIPLHDSRYKYINAATHADSQAFRKRQEERVKQAQRQMVIPLRRKA
jgi:hypothetical protein